MKNAEVKRMFSAAKKANVLELFVYDAIGGDWWTGEGITVKQIADAIKSAGKFDSILVHVNSPGGIATDGVAIQALLRQPGVPVHVLVEGMAASAAFTVAMAGDIIEVAENGLMMLHNGWLGLAGNAKELRKAADILDKLDGTEAAAYAKRSGQTIEAVKVLLDAETWLTADEAIALGFADSKFETTPAKSAEAKALLAQFDLAKMFTNVPDALTQTAEGEPETEVETEVETESETPEPTDYSAETA